MSEPKIGRKGVTANPAPGPSADVTKTVPKKTLERPDFRFSKESPIGSSGKAQNFVRDRQRIVFDHAPFLLKPPHNPPIYSHKRGWPKGFVG